jgi:UDP-2,4-diacetamido-2,4,6-trideoxy-beta-L-altropyranose hydrolase
MAHPRVTVVTTAHAAIGTGHLRRCLALAEAVQQAGGRTRFLVYEGDPALREWVRPFDEQAVIAPALGLEQALEQAEPGWPVVVDSYAVTAAHLQRLLDRGARVLVVDDLVDRPLPATWLLNSCVVDPAAYATLTRARLLLGPAYALLRSQFAGLPAHDLRPAAARLLLTFGGSDILGLGNRVLRLLDALPGPFTIRVAAGRLAGRELPGGHRHDVQMLHDVADMAEQMQWADLAVAAAGQTIFELAATGCPALCLQVADNQRFTGELFARLGSALVRDARQVPDGELSALLEGLTIHAAQRATMSRSGQAAVDGRGAARVAAALLASATLS